MLKMMGWEKIQRYIWKVNKFKYICGVISEK